VFADRSESDEELLAALAPGALNSEQRGRGKGQRGRGKGRSSGKKASAAGIRALQELYTQQLTNEQAYCGLYRTYVTSAKQSQVIYNAP